MHTGENLTAVLAQREAGRDKPMMMSDALSANHLEDETALIRCYCLCYGLRKFTDIDETFPLECRRVIDEAVFEREALTRKEAMSADERLRYHQTCSGPILERLKGWLEQQVAERTVKPNASLGKAFSYLLVRWESLVRALFAHAAGFRPGDSDNPCHYATSERSDCQKLLSDESVS